MPGVSDGIRGGDMPITAEMMKMMGGAVGSGGWVAAEGDTWHFELEGVGRMGWGLGGLRAATIAEYRT